MTAVTLAEDLPFAGVVLDGRLNSACFNCYREFEHSLPEKCHTCGYILYCSDGCQRQDMKFHRQECKLIQKTRSLPSTLTRLISRMAVRISRDDVLVAFNGRTFADMLDHVKEYKENSGTAEDPEDRYQQKLPENAISKGIYAKLRKNAKWLEEEKQKAEKKEEVDT